MSSMTILRAADHRRMPWKNGGGVTTEIAIFPEDANLSTFGWRVSMATVASDGPFSLFPGIDRTLSILDGAGMTLAIAGRPPTRLGLDNDPLAFPADIEVSATLAAGPITDLNVMTRRGSYDHRVEKLSLQEDDEFAPGNETTLLLVLGAITLTRGERTVALEKYDCLLAFQPETSGWNIATKTPVEAYRIDIGKR